MSRPATRAGKREHFAPYTVIHLDPVFALMVSGTQCTLSRIEYLLSIFTKRRVVHIIDHAIRYLVGKILTCDFPWIDDEENLRTSGTTALLDLVDLIRRDPFREDSRKRIE